MPLNTGVGTFQPFNSGESGQFVWLIGVSFAARDRNSLR